MTLKVSHNAFEGMVLEFHNWRCAVAEAAGYPIKDNGQGYRSVVLYRVKVTEPNIAGVWTAPPPDPLLVLLVHDDMGGRIAPEDAIRLADRLSSLTIPTEWMTVTGRFIEGCRLAASRKQSMKFKWDPAAIMRHILAKGVRDKVAVEAKSSVPSWLSLPSSPTIH